MPALAGVEILSTGTWKGIPVTEDSLDRMVTNFQRFGSSLKPFAKLGHDDQQILAQRDGQPALGWVERIYRQGRKLFADFTDVPKRLLEAISAGRYRRVSVEFFPKLEDTTLGAKFGAPDATGPVLLAVAFLGAEMPEVHDLADLPRILSGEDLDGAMLLAAPLEAGAVAVSAEPSMEHAVIAALRAALPAALTEILSSHGIIHASSATTTGAVSMADTPKQPTETPSEKLADKPIEFAAAIEAAKTSMREEFTAIIHAKDATIERLGANLTEMREKQTASEAKARQLEAEAFADSLLMGNTARITQAMKPWVVALCTKLDHGAVLLSADEAKAVLGKDEPPVTLSAQDCLRRLLLSLPPLRLRDMATAPADTPDTPGDWDGVVRFVAKERGLDANKPEEYRKATDLAFKDKRWEEQAKRYGRA